MSHAASRPRRIPSSTVFAAAALAIVLLPLLAGLATSLSPDGLHALAYWWRDARGWRLLARSLAFASTGAAFALAFGTTVGAHLRRQAGLIVAGQLAVWSPAIVLIDSAHAGALLALGIAATVVAVREQHQAHVVVLERAEDH